MEAAGGGGGRSVVDEDVKKMEMGVPAARDQTPPFDPPPPNSTGTNTAVMPIVINLVLRAATAVFLLIALIVIAATKWSDRLNAYRYVIAVSVIGFAYTLLQIAFTVYRLLMKKRLADDNIMIHVDFYADKALSYFLATGAAAGLGLSVDAKDSIDYDSTINGGIASSSLVFIAFLFSAASSILSSFSLPNKST